MIKTIEIVHIISFSNVTYYTVRLNGEEHTLFDDFLTINTNIVFLFSGAVKPDKTVLQKPLLCFNHRRHADAFIDSNRINLLLRDCHSSKIRACLCFVYNLYV